MKPLARPLATAFLLVFFARCANHPSDKHELGTDFTIIPMNEYPIDSSDIATGSQVRIIAYSGGKGGKDKKLYYSQFIVVDPVSGGDTTRILAAAIGVDSSAGGTGEYFSPVDAYDGQKGVFDAVYEKLSGDQNEMVSLMSDLPGENSDPEKLKSSINDTAAVKEFVLVNKGANVFKGNYKTAKGILRFHVQPWSE